MHDYFNNALPYYEHYCQRGKDTICEGVFCGGHATCTHQNMLKNLQKKWTFTKKDEKMNELSLKNCDLLLWVNDEKIKKTFFE